MRFVNMMLGLSMGAGALMMAMTGCGDETGGGTSNTTSSSSSSSGSNAFPCSPADPVCNQVKSDCISLADNAAGGSFALRMSQLAITAPAVLGTGAVGGLVSNGVLMDLPQCNLAGGGDFSWILSFDTGAGTMTTGGSKPVADPTAGFCLLDATLDTTPVKPVTVMAKPTNGEFAADVGDLVVPIFLDDTGSSFVLMPLKSTKISGKLSADNNCIGKYNADTLDPKLNCTPDTGEFAFTNGGSLEGHILLEDADKIEVSSLMQSLCVLLSGNAAMYGDGGTPAKCKRDPATMEILYKGDWCDSTNAAADATCADAQKMKADYAASGVKLTGACP